MYQGILYYARFPLREIFVFESHINKIYLTAVDINVKFICVSTHARRVLTTKTKINKKLI